MTAAAGWQFSDALSTDIDLGFAHSRRTGNVSAFDSAIGQVIFVPASQAGNPLSQDLVAAVSSDIADGPMSRDDRTRYVTMGADWRFTGATVLRLDHAWSATAANIQEPVLVGDTSSLYTLLLTEATGTDALAGARMRLIERKWPEARNTLEETTLRFSSSEWELPAGPASLTLSGQRLYAKFAGPAEASTARRVTQRGQRTLSVVASGKVPLADRRSGDAVARLYTEMGIRRDAVLIDASPDATEKKALRFSSVSLDLAFRWQAFDWLAFRTRCSTGFLPPPLSSLSDRTPMPINGLHLVDPERGNEPLDSALVESGGNYELRPERSRSCGAGLSLTDAEQDRWRFAVDYNRLAKRHVVLPPAELFFRNPQQYLVEFASRLRRDPVAAGGPWSVGKIVAIETWSINIARQEVESFDIQFAWNGHLAGGAVTTSMLASAQPESTHRAATVSAQLNDAGIGNLASPIWRATASVTWTRGGLTLGFAGRHSAAYDVSREEPIRLSQGNGRVGSQSFFDVFTSYDFGNSLPGAEGTQLRFYAQNVLGSSPATDLGELGYASRLGAEELRSIGLSLNVLL